MNLIRILGIYYLYLIQTIDTKKFRVVVGEEMLNYDLDKNVSPYSDVLSADHFIAEQIDDDIVELSGYLMAKVTMDQALPLVTRIRTQYYHNSIWNEGMLQMTLPNTCSEFINPRRPTYNVTKLWTNCPIKKGERWNVTTQFVDATLELPPSIPLVPWRMYFLGTQGIPGFEKLNYGYGFNFELVAI